MSEASISPLRKRICDKRDPVRTRIEKVRGRDFCIKRTLITGGHLIKLLRIVSNHPGEHIEPSG